MSNDNCFTIKEHRASMMGVGEAQSENKLIVKSSTFHLERQGKKKFVNGWVDQQKFERLVDGHLKGKFQEIEVVGIHGVLRIYPISHIAVVDETDDSKLLNIAICWS